jgi:hypothetical protein
MTPENHRANHNRLHHFVTNDRFQNSIDYQQIASEFLLAMTVCRLLGEGG